MGWSLGHDGRFGKYGRDIGYGVPAVCDQPDCKAKIDRGLSYVCGSDVHGGEHGCGLFFCGDHRRYIDRDDAVVELCARCETGADAFEPKPDVRKWVKWKLTDASWAQWRKENAAEVAEMRAALADGATMRPPVIEGENSRDEPIPSQNLPTGRDGEQ